MGTDMIKILNGIRETVDYDLFSSIKLYHKFPGITSSKQHEYIEKFMVVCKYITNHCTPSEYKALNRPKN
ncbi:MAG: hypothetical protein HFI62_06355 [Lachnospiraceae bacterium]|mgnify:FL=1|nr:hypothetical protein [Lachnospiraceae bacterium]